MGNKIPLLRFIKTFFLIVISTENSRPTPGYGSAKDLYDTTSFLC